MILLINICREKLHYYEFVTPIEDILKKSKIDYFVKYYKKLSKEDLRKADKVIICGTSLKDNEFIKDLDCFLWIKDYKKPILGICGGMQLIGLVFGGKLQKKKEIGFYNENFEGFLGLIGEQEVYHLHNNSAKFGDGFKEHSKSKTNQAVKHKEKEIYGVLFHPEVRNKSLIIKFCNLF
jgi:GMP synthase-like glutamine amidotransferase